MQLTVGTHCNIAGWLQELPQQRLIGTCKWIHGRHDRLVVASQSATLTHKQFHVPQMKRHYVLRIQHSATGHCKQVCHRQVRSGSLISLSWDQNREAKTIQHKETVGVKQERGSLWIKAFFSDAPHGIHRFKSYQRRCRIRRPVLVHDLRHDIVRNHGQMVSLSADQFHGTNKRIQLSASAARKI